MSDRSWRVAIVFACSAWMFGAHAFAQGAAGTAPSAPRVRAEGCSSLDVAAVERLLAIEWRDASVASVDRGSSVIELQCVDRSVNVRFRLENDSESRVRTIDVGEGEWPVAPRIIALVSAQLAVSDAREREDARRRELDAREAHRAREERARERAAEASRRAQEPPAFTGARYALDLGLGLRFRQWDAPWWSAGVSVAFSLRLARSVAWLGVWSDFDVAGRSEALGDVRYARGAVGPTFTLASDPDAAVSAHARFAALVGAQSAWAFSAQSTVDAGSLASASVEARVRAGIAGRLSRSLSLSFDVDAAIEFVSLDGRIGASRELRTGGAVLGAALSLSWRASRSGGML